VQHKLSHIPSSKQECFFPESLEDKIWQNTNYVRRYHLNFPFYPFRTLCPRDLHRLALTSSSKNSSFDFNSTSPLFPANTQINIVLKKRNTNNFLPYMLAYHLDQSLGSSSMSLTEQQKNTATSYTVLTRGTGDNAAVVTNKYIITKVEIKIYDIYMQVIIFLC